MFSDQKIESLKIKHPYMELKDMKEKCVKEWAALSLEQKSNYCKLAQQDSENPK